MYNSLCNLRSMRLFQLFVCDVIYFIGTHQSNSPDAYVRAQINAIANPPRINGVNRKRAHTKGSRARTIWIYM